MIKNKRKFIALALILIVLLIITVYYAPSLSYINGGLTTKNFEECVAAGYPVMESYPRQCRTPDGKVFVEQINNGQIFCRPEDREAEACIKIYQPVCGWFDPAKIQCIRYPCAVIFGNPCSACMDENVLYYTEGECPE